MNVGWIYAPTYIHEKGGDDRDQAEGDHHLVKKTKKKKKKKKGAAIDVAEPS